MDEKNAKVWLALVVAFNGAMAVAQWYVTALNGDPDDDVDDAEQQELTDEASGAVALVNSLRQRIGRFAYTLMRQHGAGSPYYEALYQAYDTMDAELANAPEVDGVSLIVLRGGEYGPVYQEVSDLFAKEGE